MFGRKEYQDVVYLIDFGLSKRYRDPKTGQHVKFVNNRSLNGTAKYASTHALEGYETSRRDDLEGLAYVLVYFLNGHLPWERIKNKNKQERYKLILAMKKKINEQNLVGDKNNIEFIEFVKYCRKLKFEENPDYKYLRGLMLNCINKNNKTFDNFYNISLNKNLIIHSHQRNKPNPDYFKNVSQNQSGKNTRSNSTKLKTNKSNNLMVSKNNENKEIIEENDFDNKIINESKNSSLGCVEKKIKHYSNFNNHGIKEIQLLITSNKKKNMCKKNTSTNINKTNMDVINKNKTSFRNQNNQNSSNNKSTSIDHKKIKRTKLYFIKRGLGIEQNRNTVVPNDSNNMIRIKQNIEGEIEDNNIKLKEESCIII
jgi:hypothetical protein